MKKRTFTLQSKVWLYPGMSGWHFLSIPIQESTEIKRQFSAHAKGWGSLPVTVSIHKTSWDTSIFPDKKSGMYLLPLKASVRKAEDIFVDDTLQFTLRIR